MRHWLAVLYLALTGVANAGAAEDWSDLVPAVEALRTGDMQKLAFYAEPIPAPEGAFLDESGAEMTLAAYEGQWVVLNFWATWCAPCRVEMPTLSNLQTQMGGAALQVVTIATGRNDIAGIDRFFEEIGVTNLPRFTDPRSTFARDFGVMGLPVTVILNPEGEEVARLMGDAHWDSESALAILGALVGRE